ncbi:MAG: hypothetical protein AAF266_05390 [Planctomycetota bacterium]
MAPVLVGRFAGQQQLGYYTLGVSLYVVATAMARSLVWTTYTKELHHHDDRKQAELTGSSTIHLLGYALATAIVIGTIASVSAGLGHAQLAWFFAVLAPAAAAMLVREHVRRLAMAKIDFVGVLVLDVLVAVAQVGSLVWLATAERLTATSAFVAVAISSLLSLGWLIVYRDRFSLRWGRVVPDWLHSWKTSKWLVAASSSVTIGNQGYRWVLPALASLAELGRLGAAQVVVQFTNPLVIGLSNYIGPLTAKLLAEKGVHELWRYTRRLSVLMAAGIATFVVGVGFFGVPLVQLLLGDGAEGVTRLLVVTLTAGALSEALLIPIQAATVNRGEARQLTSTAILRLVINVSIGYGLVGVFGAEAIGIGMLVGSLATLAWLWRAFEKELSGV